MELKLHDNSGGGAVELSDAVFDMPYRDALVHQVVTAYRAGGRAGTKAQKTRAEVRGGGRKPWRQKGTGRARAGSVRSPLWVGGGKTFAAEPRSYDQKINRKMYRGAMRSMLSELRRQERLVLAESFAVEAPKTRQVVERLEQLGVAQALIVVEGFDEALFLAARNLPNVEVLEATEIDPVSLARWPYVVMTVPAAKRIEEWLS